MNSGIEHDLSHDHEHHIVPVATYAATLGALLVLMGLTVGISYVHLGSIGNNVVAMTIAIFKALLVVMIFMGVKYGTKLTKLWAATGFIWLTLMGIILIDYTTRGNEVVPTGFYGDTGSSLRGFRPPQAPQDTVPNLRLHQ